MYKWKYPTEAPRLEELIAKAIAAAAADRKMDYQHPDRPDKVMAMLAAVNQAVLTDNTPQRWEAGIRVIYEASRHEMDVALAGAKPLARNMPKGAKMDTKVVKELFPRIIRALEG